MPTYLKRRIAAEVTDELDRKVRYELDGGDQSKIRSFHAAVEPGALRLCVPNDEETR